jgi:predicted transcriptional regulator
MGTAPTLNPGEVVRQLRRNLALTEADLATATDASPRTVRRWLAGDVDPQTRYADRIDDLREVTELLGEMLNPEGIKQWLRRRNRKLNSARPIDKIGQGHFDDVQRAAESYLQGDY